MDAEKVTNMFLFTIIVRPIFSLCGSQHRAMTARDQTWETRHYFKIAV